MESSSSDNWSYADTLKAGRPCRVYTELNGQFETENMDAFGHGSFQFYKKKVQANAIQVGCSNERRGCKVRALISLGGKFLRYLGEPHGSPVHNHFPFYGSSCPPSTKTSPQKSHSSLQRTPTIMTRIGKNRQGYQFYKCPKGYAFFVNGISKLKIDIIELEMSCADRRDGCKARITCDSENLAISRERGDHNHDPIPEDILRTRDFEIHHQDPDRERRESLQTQILGPQKDEDSSEETDTDSSVNEAATEERTLYCSEIIRSEDGSRDFWADPVSVCADHNYTVDPRSKREKEPMPYQVDGTVGELVVISADSFHEVFGHLQVPDAEIVVEIPFDSDEGQVGQALRDAVCGIPIKY